MTRIWAVTPLSKLVQALSCIGLVHAVVYAVSSHVQLVCCVSETVTLTSASGSYILSVLFSTIIHGPLDNGL